MPKKMYRISVNFVSFDTHYANRGLRNPQAPGNTLYDNLSQSVISILEFSQDACLSLKEGLDFQNLILRHRAADLELGHLGDSLLESLDTAVMVVWPGEGYIPQGRSLEAVSVALHTGLGPAAVVAVGEA